jgi:hypothetical protein
MLKELENWYLLNCNEEWEHKYGITIESLDNPGWRITIDLVDTKLERVKFQEVENIKNELEWIVCKVENKIFIGAGGPKELENIIKNFMNWVKTNNAV